MRRAVVVLLVFIVGCRFELPEAGIAAPGDAPPADSRIDAPPVDALPVDAPSVDAPGCPADFMPLPGGPPGHVYRKVPQNGPWFQQFNFCISISRAYLAVPDSFTELMNLRVLAAAPVFWVGIDDRVIEGMYDSAEGGPATFLPWEPGEPDNAPGDGDCVLAWGGVLSDEDCFGNIRAAVCECNP